MWSKTEYESVSLEMKDENSRLRCCLISGMTALIPFCSYVTVLKKKLMMPPPLLFLPKSASAEVLVYIKFLKEGTNLRQQHRVNSFYMSLCSQLQNIQKTKNNKWVKYIYIFLYICIYFILYIYYFILYIYKRIYIYPLMYKTTYIKNKTKQNTIWYTIWYSIAGFSNRTIFLWVVPAKRWWPWSYSLPRRAQCTFPWGWQGGSKSLTADSTTVRWFRL